MVLCLGEPPVRFLCCCCSFLIFIFCCCIFICQCSSFCCYSSHFLFDVIPHPSMDYRRGFYTSFYTFSPAHRRVIRNTFICSTTPFLPRVLRPWVGLFLPTGVFYLALLHRHFNLHLSWFPWEPAVLPGSLQGFILILKTQTWPICLFDWQ